MRLRRKALGIRQRLIEHAQSYAPIRERYARLMGRPAGPDPLIEALDSGERVELPSWSLSSALPDLRISVHPDAPQFYIVEVDGSLTPSDENDDPRFLRNALDGTLMPNKEPRDA